MIDRSFGIWANNVDVHAPVGLISTNDTVYFTWQDSRNGTDEGSAEDTYFATVRHAQDDGGDAGGVSRWLVVGAGLAAGMGVAMLVFVVSKRCSS